MVRVKINTSDIDWIKRHAVAEPVIHGTDIKGNVYFSTEIEVATVEHVTFAHAKMIRFDLGADWPSDATRSAMYPEAYLLPGA